MPKKPSRNELRYLVRFAGGGCEDGTSDDDDDDAGVPCDSVASGVLPLSGPSPLPSDFRLAAAGGWAAVCVGNCRRGWGNALRILNIPPYWFLIPGRRRLRA